MEEGNRASLDLTHLQGKLYQRNIVDRTVNSDYRARKKRTRQGRHREMQRWWRALLEGSKEMFYLTTHSTHFIYGYTASDMVKDHSYSEKGNPLLPHRLLFTINSKGSFRQDSTYHGLCYTSRGALAGTRNGSMG